MLQLFYGNAVRGDQRFDRPMLQNRLLAALRGGAGVKMFGLRRIGKSTLRLFVLDELRTQGRQCVDIDCQGLGSLADLLGRLFAEFQKREGMLGRVMGYAASGPARGVIEAIATGAGQQDAMLSAYWQAVSSAIRQALAEDGAAPVLVIDEFTFLLRNMIVRGGEAGKADAERLLASMREWRADGMTMLLTGSIGLVALAREHGLSREHINDLQPFDVPELTEAEARDFIAQATEGAGERWTAEHSDELIRQLAARYPCFLVKALQEIGVTDPCPPGDFGAVFSTTLRPFLFRDFDTQFRSRFQAYRALPDDWAGSLIVPALAAIMREEGCADTDIPCPDSFTPPDLAEALDMLIEDGFVRFTEERDGTQHWMPASRLALGWWRRARLTRAGATA